MFFSALFKLALSCSILILRLSGIARFIKSTVTNWIIYTTANKGQNAITPYLASFSYIRKSSSCVNKDFLNNCISILVQDWQIIFNSEIA